MGDDLHAPHTVPAFDPRTTPVPRRRVLLLIGVGALAAGSLATVLEGCVGPPVPVELDIDPDDLVPGTPTEVEFTVDLGGKAVPGSAWLVKKSSGEIIAYDPRCTHGLCSYGWVPDAGQFSCNCHDGQFALDGTVISGKPTRPLDRLPVRITGDVVEVDVPGNFATPRESLPE
jgi:cytochrome b6-f complex iron-sulfur subunit